jgi:erythromycin esterase-like protein
MIGLNYVLLGNPKDLDLILDRIGEPQFVLLGESSHELRNFTNGVVKYQNA